MELREYLHAVRRGWVLVIAAVAVALAAALLMAVVRAPSYRSTTVLFVSFGPTTDASTVEQRIESYLALLRGPRVAGAVGLRTGLPQERVSERLVAERAPGTALLTLTATDPSRSRATDLAASATTVLQTVAAEVEKGSAKGTITVAQPPVTTPVPSRLPLDAALAALLGLVAGLALVAARELTAGSVAGADAVRRRFGVDTVETIAADEAAHEPFRRLRTRLRAQAAAPGRMTLLVTAATREDGAKATCWSLAEAFAEAGTSVVVVDADLRAPGVLPSPGLAEALAGERSIVDVLRTRGPGQVSSVGSGAAPDDPGPLLAGPAIGEAIGDLQNLFDVVLVLAPPVQGSADAAQLATVTGGAILAVRADRTRVADLDRTVSTLRSVGAEVVAVFGWPRRSRPSATAVPPERLDDAAPAKPSPRPAVRELHGERKTSSG